MYDLFNILNPVLRLQDQIAQFDMSVQIFEKLFVLKGDVVPQFQVVINNSCIKTFIIFFSSKIDSKKQNYRFLEKQRSALNQKKKTIFEALEFLPI